MDELNINEAERAALENADFFRTKAILDEKTKLLFQQLKKLLDQSINTNSKHIPPAFLKAPGRRFQGENHHGFPWRAFDFPRAVSGNDIFLFRILLLWGQGFSIHLILGGAWKERFQAKLAALPAPLLQQDWQIDLRESPWDWLPASTDLQAYSQSSPMETEAILAQKSTFKMSLYFAASEFPRIPAHADQAWQNIIQALLQS